MKYRLDDLARRAMVGQKVEIKGPPQRLIGSRMGGYFVCAQGESHPGDGANPLFPYLQIAVGELPFVPPGMDPDSIVCIYLGPNFEFDGQSGEPGFLVREYSTTRHALIACPDEKRLMPRSHIEV